MPPRSLDLTINPDICEAETLPGMFYSDSSLYERAKEEIFARSWQLISHKESVRVPGQVFPFTLLEGCLDEPLLLTRDSDDKIHCISNVCTHRGMLVCEHAGVHKTLKCRYHGRRFALDGKFQSMPECTTARNFPRPSESLPALGVEEFGEFLFTSLNPAIPFEEVFSEIRNRVGWIPFDTFTFDPNSSRDYLVRCNWALYCENYLEGFHIPYVHSGLNDILDYGEYTTEVYRYSNLQLGIAREGELSFNLPASSPDYGRRIGAYYFWIFPNLMLNFYPWGLSVNIVKPLGVDRTRVSFLTYVWNNGQLRDDHTELVGRVEREDEAIVEAVSKGVRSRLYTRGRFSPSREAGCHHFHRLMSEFLPPKV